MKAIHALAISTAIIAATVVLSPLLPSVDFPQHVASAELLRRLWFAPSEVQGGDVVFNPATHNAGVQLFAAALGQLIGVHLAARVFFALALVLQVLGLARLAESLGLPRERALVIVPVLLGFSMVWGLANFAMGTGLSLLALGIMVSQIDKPSTRLVWLPILSLLVSLTHVMTMLLLAIFAAGLGIERAVRARGDLRLWVRTAGVGALLLPGCVYDLWVLSRHLGIDAASYTTSDTLVPTPGPLRKLALLGTFGSGVYAPYTDIVLAWVLVGLLVYGLVRGLRRGGEPSDRPTTASVLGISLALYLLIPSVFLNTHLVYQRLALWVILGLGLAVPARAALLPGGVALNGALARLALCAAALAPLHFGVLAYESRHVRGVLGDLPRGARVTGVIEATRASSLRTPTLAHVHALAVAEGAEDGTFSFARYMGGPVVYDRGRVPPYPSPSWEHDGHAYRWDHPLARSFPWVLLRIAHLDEATSDVCARLFAQRCVDAKLVSRRGDTLLWDTRGLTASSATTPTPR